ncbi:MAG: copper resistance CopC family protein, partial [Minisyncoccia bacterium]
PRDPYMKHLASFIALFVVALPFLASAHASPVEYKPASSARLSEAPHEVRIRFSERAEHGASRILVADESGNRLNAGESVVDANDPYVLSVPITHASDGAFFVTWSVVSSDDGHFTKGGYAYFVGGATGSVPTAPQMEIAQLSAIPEASAMFVELLGNSFLWGALILFAFVLRYAAASAEEKRHMARVYSIMIWSGVFLILAGALVHVALKTSELASLHELPFKEALPLYLATVSGFATIIRAGAAVAFAVFFALFARRIVAAPRFTWMEALLFCILLVFAFFRAKVSHATANPFFPEFSVLVNLFHLIGKGLWEGILAGVCALFLFRTLRSRVTELLPQAFKVLAIAFGITGPTAAYIVWLHLKDISNLSSTLWGERFIPLCAVAVLAAVLLVYHVVLNRYHPRFVGSLLPYTLPAEFAIGVLVVFFSSLMIITSPPLEENSGALYATESNGLEISLEKSRFEDGMALLTVRGGEKIKDPVVMLGGDEGIILELERRFDGGYAFPLSVFTPDASHDVRIAVAQENAYDATAQFSVEREYIDPKDSHGRVFDLLAALCTFIGIASIMLAIALYRLSHTNYLIPNQKYLTLKLATGFVGGIILASQLIGLGVFLFANEFKKECLVDGNGWHIMLPSKNGIPVSSTPHEGCMTLGGSFHIVDAREYRYLKSPEESSVEFSTDLSSLRAGIPITLNFSIRDADGKPALLSVQHERLVHMIVISKDMREFRHAHPDDTGTLSDVAVRTASFSIPFTFPKAGDYLIALDYAHGLSLESRTLTVSVSGAPTQSEEEATYPSQGTFDGYDVSLKYQQPFAGEVSTLVYTIEKDGKPVTDLSPYLAAAMHVAIVKNDLTEFAHTHGEVHKLGEVVPLPSVTSVHNHAPPPPRFGPMVEAHPVFPSAGIYTVFGQFMHEGNIITNRFTVRVE